MACSLHMTLDPKPSRLLTCLETRCPQWWRFPGPLGIACWSTARCRGRNREGLEADFLRNVSLRMEVENEGSASIQEKRKGAARDREGLPLPCSSQTEC